MLTHIYFLCLECKRNYIILNKGDNLKPLMNSLPLYCCIFTFFFFSILNIFRLSQYHNINWTLGLKGIFFIDIIYSNWRRKIFKSEKSIFSPKNMINKPEILVAMTRWVQKTFLKIWASSTHYCKIQIFENLWWVPTENGESRTHLGEWQGPLINWKDILSYSSIIEKDFSDYFEQIWNENPPTSNNIIYLLMTNFCMKE